MEETLVLGCKQVDYAVYEFRAIMSVMTMRNRRSTNVEPSHSYRFQNPLLLQSITLRDAQLINKGEAMVVYRTVANDDGLKLDGNHGEERRTKTGQRDETVQRMGENSHYILYMFPVYKYYVLVLHVHHMILPNLLVK